VDVVAGDVRDARVVLAGRLIAGVGDDYTDAAEVVDLGGRWLAPGLIDGHVHLESSLVAPREYARAVVPRGVTGVVCDPHEIGNVAGVAGIRWFLDASEGLPLDVWVGVPSCVPSSSLETSGARLGLAEIASFMDHPRVVGVAEIMDLSGVLAGEEEVLAKVLLAEMFRKIPCGHAPLLRGRSLHAYLAAGIVSDHESTESGEALEKLRAGCFLMVREGSVTRNLEALASVIQTRWSDRVGLVTDDRLPHDLLEEGGVDFLVRKAIRLGVDPLLAVRCATWNVARHFRLPRRGAVAPGYLADLVVLDDLPTFRAGAVYKEGRPVAQDGHLRETLPALPAASSTMLHTVRLPALSPSSFRVRATTLPVRCLRLVPNQILTEQVWVHPRTAGGDILPDPVQDIAKLVCVERHGRGGTIGVGLVTGFGLTEGALASTVAHDHHNLMAVGTQDDDILAACRRLAEIQGGFVVAARGRVRAELPLPIAGLMTDRPLAEVRAALDTLEDAARALGVRIPSPFMTLSFLGLPVIRELRLTDRGLVDAARGRLVPLGAET
jgi:adenine deaminase